MLRGRTRPRPRAGRRRATTRWTRRRNARVRAVLALGRSAAGGPAGRGAAGPPAPAGTRRERQGGARGTSRRGRRSSPPTSPWTGTGPSGGRNGWGSGWPRWGRAETPSGEETSVLSLAVATGPGRAARRAAPGRRAALLRRSAGPLHRRGSSASRRARSRAGCTRRYGPCAPACTRTRWCDVTAHDNSEPRGDRTPLRKNAGREGPRHEDPPHDALAAALFDEPPPEGAGEDAAYRAARERRVRRSCVLKEQLTLIGDALAGRGGRSGRRGAARGGRGGRAAPRTDHARHAAPATVPVPAAEGCPRRARRRCRRRAGARPGLGSCHRTAAPADSASRGGAAADAKEDTGAPAFGTPRYLACARLVAEGRVTPGWRSVPGTGGVQRVTLRGEPVLQGGPGR
ncbi:hypothetical protein STENM223S_09732 [Streptomyces tendae]